MASSTTQPSVSPSSDTPSQASVLPVTPTPDPDIKPEDAQPPPSSFSPTRSESVAQKVLSSGGSFTSSLGNGFQKSDQFAAAMAAGAGVSGNPIYVTLAERELQSLFRIPFLKFRFSFSQRNVGIPVD